MLQADYDRASGLVAAFIDDDHTPSYQPTGAPVPDGADVERVLVETVWPDPFLPGHPQLLGNPHITWDEDRDALVRTYPDANYSPTALRAAIGEQLDAMARLALGATDWAVVRRAETGQDVPPGITARRLALRAWHADREAALGAAPAGALLNFDTIVPEALWRPSRG